MPVSDPWASLALSRRRYADAIARRHAVRPGEPGYRQAVHEVGVAWAQVRRWERATGSAIPRGLTATRESVTDG